MVLYRTASSHVLLEVHYPVYGPPLAPWSTAPRWQNNRQTADWLAFLHERRLHRSNDSLWNPRMLEEKIHALPGHLIRRAYQHAWGVFTDLTKDLNFTPVQYSVLSVVSEFPSVDASRISEMLTVDRATVGNVVQRLEARGLLMRTPDPSDARAKNLFITPSGQEIMKKISRKMPEIRKNTLAGLDTDEQEELLRLLAKLVEIDQVKSNTANYRAAVHQFKVSLKGLARNKR